MKIAIGSEEVLDILNEDNGKNKNTLKNLRKGLSVHEAGLDCTWWRQITQYCLFCYTFQALLSSQKSQLTIRKYPSMYFLSRQQVITVTEGNGCGGVQVVVIDITKQSELNCGSSRAVYQIRFCERSSVQIPNMPVEFCFTVWLELVVSAYHCYPTSIWCFRLVSDKNPNNKF